jgi:transposase
MGCKSNNGLVWPKHHQEVDMKDVSNLDVDLSIGLDLGDKLIHYCLLESTGEVTGEGSVRTTKKDLRRFLSRYSCSKVAFEVGTHSPWVKQVVEETGHEAIVANPRNLRLIYKSDKKNDRADAAYLARLARVDPSLLSPIQHRSPENRIELGIVRSRDLVVRTRSSFIVHIRGVVKSFGHRLPSCGAVTFARKVAALIPAELQGALNPLLDLIHHLNEQIKVFDKSLDRLARERHPVMERFQQINGIGPVTAAAYTLIIEDPRRFRNSRSVGAYMGLVPRQDQSGDHEAQLRVTKAGDSLLRRLLTHAAHYILGPFGTDSDLRRFGQKIATRGGKNAKKRAIVAVARKLAVLMHHLWITGKVYDPNYSKKRTVDRRVERVPAT